MNKLQQILEYNSCFVENKEYNKYTTSKKPDANDKIINGMVMGRIKKELKEICLMDQVYVKAEDGKQTVGKYVAEVAKANNAKIEIKGFVRYMTGEGIEKKQEDFASEVAAQMNNK